MKWCDVISLKGSEKLLWGGKQHSEMSDQKLKQSLVSRQVLGSLLLPGHIRLRAQLDEVLDMELIRQQVEHNALDLHRLAEFIIHTMASLCAPVRDPEVRALQDLEGPVELLR